jgi:hypothetical protein
MGQIVKIQPTCIASALVVRQHGSQGLGQRSDAFAWRRIGVVVAENNIAAFPPWAAPD